MTFPRYFALCRYWRKNPPLQKMVQAYLGIKDEGSEGGADHRELAGLFGPGSGVNHVG